MSRRAADSLAWVSRLAFITSFADFSSTYIPGHRAAKSPPYTVGFPLSCSPDDAQLSILARSFELAAPSLLVRQRLRQLPQQSECGRVHLSLWSGSVYGNFHSRPSVHSRGLVRPKQLVRAPQELFRPKQPVHFHPSKPELDRSEQYVHPPELVRPKQLVVPPASPVHSRLQPHWQTGREPDQAANLP